MSHRILLTNFKLYDPSVCVGIIIKSTSWSCQSWRSEDGSQDLETHIQSRNQRDPSRSQFEIPKFILAGKVLFEVTFKNKLSWLEK